MKFQSSWHQFISNPHRAWLNDHFTHDLARAQGGEGGRDLFQGEDLRDGWFEFALSGPIERRFNVFAPAPVAAGQFLLLDEKGPELEGHVAARRRAASDNGPAAGQAVETLRQDGAADVFDHEIDAPLARDLAHVRRPVGLGSVNNMGGAQAEGKLALGVRRAGGDDLPAELPGDLDSRGTRRRWRRP